MTKIHPSPPGKHPPRVGLSLSLAAVAVIYSVPLYQLGRFAFHSDLYSYTLLVPLISGYIAYSVRDRTPVLPARQRTPGLLLLAGGGAIAGGYLVAKTGGRLFETQDYLACLVLSFVFCVAGLYGTILGAKALRTVAFPLGFLCFMAPFPLFFEKAVNTLLQEASAVTALGLFKLSDTPVFYTHLIFQLPGITIEVAPECSGIHSTLVLLITSFLAGFFFLRTLSKRIILALAILPLAILRNAFRIFIIGELCVKVSPDMINSAIHRRGGPLFFALSLLPLSALLWGLWRADRKTEEAASAER